MHDAVEILLELCAEKERAPFKRDRPFMEYWNILPNLPGKGTMLKLNNARVGLKHHGQRVSQDQLTAHLVNTRDFLDETCRVYFNLSLSEVSLKTLIRNDKIKRLLEAASIELEKERDIDYESVFSNAAVAFAFGMRDIHRRLHVSFPITNMLRLTTLLEGGNISHSLETAIGEITRAIENITVDYGRATGLLSLGIDLRDYEAFRELTPVIHDLGNDQPVMDWYRKPAESREDAQWCIDFVVDFMLRAEAPVRRANFAQPPLSLDDIPI